MKFLTYSFKLTFNCKLCFSPFSNMKRKLEIGCHFELFHVEIITLCMYVFIWVNFCKYDYNKIFVYFRQHERGFNNGVNP